MKAEKTVHVTSLLLSGIVGLNMLQSLLEQKHPLIADSNIEFYTPSEWKIVNATVNVFQLLDKGTEELYLEEYPTPLMTIPVIYNMGKKNNLL